MNYQSDIIRDHLSWNEYTSRSLLHEVYHTWEYHLLNTEGEPLMFVFLQGLIFIALPLIKRIIGESGFFDLTSVYGYAGPISNVNFSTVSVQTAACFKEALDQFMKAERCICIFSRLHPLLRQECLLAHLGGLRANGQTIYIDLEEPEAAQHRRYHKRLMRQVRSLRRRGYHTREAATAAEVLEFAEMYRKNMDRLNAGDSYYFDFIYFQQLLGVKACAAKLLLIYKDAEMICGAVIFLSATIIRNHLSATHPDYLGESPSKLLTDEIRRLGQEQGLRIFHLGGGVRGREDSLFRFKSYFSDLRLADMTWCYISNEPAYHALAGSTAAEEDNSFFPVYRAGRAKAAVD